MVKFIFVEKGKDEYLLNLDSIKLISPYHAAYDSEDGDISGVAITFVGDNKPTVYPGLDFDYPKKIILDK